LQVVFVLLTLLSLCETTAATGRDRGRDSVRPCARPVNDRRKTDGVEEDSGTDRAGTWHLDFGVRTAYPRLRWTDQNLDRRLDLPLKADLLHVFEHPETPLDRKSEFGLSSLYFGIGRTATKRVVWSVYGGGGVASDRTDQSFLNTALDVRFRYAFYYLGALVEYYPRGTPEAASGLTLGSSLRAGRPFLFSGLETAYISGWGKGDYRVSGLVLYEDAAYVRDWLFNVPIGVGWSIPLSDRWSLQLMGDYRFHFYRPEEYNGWHLMTGLRCRL